MIFHHAVLVSSAAPLKLIPETTLGVVPSTRFSAPQFLIADARQLISDAHRRPGGEAAEQILYIATEFIIEEAQQALLKIIEEPPVSTRFIFVIPTGYTLLPTLESRFQRVVANEEARNTKAFADFTAASYADRLALIEQSVKHKNQAWQADIKYGLHMYLLESALKLKARELSDLEYVLRLLLTRGASNKFLLEHLALTLAPRSQP